MPGSQIFSSTNHYSSNQRQVGDNLSTKREGWCAAASAIWCANMLKGRKAESSDPDMLLAGILQVKYRWNSDFLDLLKHVGIRGDYRGDLYRDGAIQFMGALPGVYHFSNAFHSMGADTRIGHNYWYDIEAGLYSYSNFDELKNDIKTWYPSVGRGWCSGARSTPGCEPLGSRGCSIGRMSCSTITRARACGPRLPPRP